MWDFYIKKGGAYVTPPPSLIKGLHLFTSQAGIIAHDFITKNGEGDKLANLIYRHQKKADEAARIIGEVAKLKTAYFGS